MSDGARPRQGDQRSDCCVCVVSDDRGPDGGLGREADAVGALPRPPCTHHSHTPRPGAASCSLQPAALCPRLSLPTGARSAISAGRESAHWLLTGVDGDRPRLPHSLGRITLRCVPRALRLSSVKPARNTFCVGITLTLFHSPALLMLPGAAS